MDDSFQLVKRLDAVKGVWTGDKWKFYQGIVQHANEKGEYDLKKFNEMEVKLPEGPQAFVRTVKEPEEMSYWELKRYAKRIRHEGYDPTRYLVDMNIKLAFPLITFVMVILGIPIALGIKKGGTPLAVSVGIAVCFLYLLTLGFSRSLGLRGVLPPLFSAWLANE
jgi:lipopolysaccharide export system permease protein